nr:hypothetical protein [uncultured Albidiferax sp.]
MKHFFVVCSFGIASSVGAQSVSFESVRLADTIMESGWSAVEQSLPLMISGFEAQLKAGGVTERAARVFGEELRLSMSRDSMSKIYAIAVSAKLSPQEIREVSTFLQSKSGLKYLSLNNDFAANPAFIQPIAKQACNSAAQRLDSGTDKSSLSSICSQL